MQIVFLNTFEKQEDGLTAVSAQLSICEKDGRWSVLWLELSGAEPQREQPPQPQVWYEGTSWEELLAAFRHGAARMMGQGYEPVIDGMLEQSRTPGSFLSMLQCYGELHCDQTLFQSLKEWRRSTAAEEKKSAYLVATNRMLWMIGAFVPKTEEELLQIPGWGKTKHAAYGAAVLAITQEAPRSTSFPLQWVADKLDGEAYRQWLFKQKENKYKTIMERHREKKKILSLLSGSGTLETLQNELSLPRRELLGRLEQLEQEGYDMEPLIERELTDVPEEEQKRIWDALASIGDRYLKPILQQVYGAEEAGTAGRSVEQLYERLRLMRLRFRRHRESNAG